MTRNDNASKQLTRLRARIARLEQSESRRRHVESDRVIFARLSQRLAAVATEQALTRVVTEETQELFGWDFCFLAHRAPDQDQLRILCYVDTVKGRKRVFPGDTQPPEHFSRPVHQVLKGKALLINRSPGRADPVLNTVGSRKRSESLMFAPVRCARRVIGFLTVQSYTPGRYGKRDLQLLRHTADAIAPAIERVYAEDALRRAHRELEDRVKQRTAELKAANTRLRRETRERRSALEAVRESEARFRVLSEHSLSGVYIFGGGRFLYVNSALASILGCTREEILAMPDPLEIIHPEDRPLADEQMRRRLSREVESAHYRFRAVRRNGEVIYCEDLGRYCEYRGKPAIVGNMLDITENIRAEKARRKSEKALRKLTIELDRRLESERTRIARELHDHLGQILTAVNMNLAWLEKRTAALDESVNSRIGECIAQVGQMTAIIRSLCKSLHPVVLDHHGLIEAIKTQIAEFQQYAQIRCDLKVSPADLEVDKPVAMTAFRIVQESLTNVARHSGASRCYVSLRLDRGCLVITVRDNGAGAPPGRLSGTRSLGILGMRERAAAAGGRFHISNLGRGGICVRADLPLEVPVRPPASRTGRSGRTGRKRDRLRLK